MQYKFFHSYIHFSKVKKKSMLKYYKSTESTTFLTETLSNTCNTWNEEKVIYNEQ